MFRRFRFLLVCWLSAAMISGGCGTTSTKKYRIVVIPKGETHQFWRAIHAGAKKAAEEHGDVEIVWDGPEQEDKHNEQRRIVERFTSEQVSAIVLAPSDRRLLVSPVKSALKMGIPVVIIDSGLEHTDAVEDHAKYLGYVATDNEAGGRLAAKRMAELFKDKKAKVMLLPYQTGSQSTELREKGFLSEIKKHKNITCITSPKDAGATLTSAQKAAEEQLALHNDLDGVFTPNESSTVGMLNALRALKRTSKVKLVGFDSSDVLLSALKKGHIEGLVLQDPFDMGYRAVKRAIAYLESGDAPASRTLNTNLAIATRDNINDAKIQRMIKPE